MTNNISPDQRKALAAATRAQQRVVRHTLGADSARIARDSAVVDALTLGLRPVEIVRATGIDRKRVESAARAYLDAAQAVSMLVERCDADTVLGFLQVVDRWIARTAP